MLTGDKQNTAIQIALLCNLISSGICVSVNQVLHLYSTVVPGTLSTQVPILYSLCGGVNVKNAICAAK